jgi:hypothetical protein
LSINVLRKKHPFCLSQRLLKPVLNHETFFFYADPPVSARRTEYPLGRPRLCAPTDHRSALSLELNGRIFFTVFCQIRTVGAC